MDIYNEQGNLIQNPENPRRHVAINGAGASAARTKCLAFSRLRAQMLK